MATITKDADTVIEEIISSIDAKALARAAEFRLSDAIREGSSCTSQEYGWGAGDTACALSAAGLSAAARGYVSR